LPLTAFGAIAHFDFNFTLEVDHVLAARRGVELVVVVAAGFAKHDAGGLRQLRDETDFS
jgi:hypothetical protein